MTDKELRRVCEERLRQLELPRRFTIETLRGRVAERRGVPIRLVPVAGQLRGPCGLWVATSDEDLIFFEARTSRLHQDHIIAHEVGHIVSDHRGVAVDEDELGQLVAPHLSGSLIARVLGRMAYTTGEEREAEMLASLILEAMPKAQPAPPRPASPELATAVAQLESALQPRWRLEDG